MSRLFDVSMYRYRKIYSTENLELLVVFLRDVCLFVLCLFIYLFVSSFACLFAYLSVSQK
jgi:hypothetical protein